MKTMRLICMVVGVALLLGSCYLASNQGTGKIIVSTGSQSRSITAGSGLIRISLFSVKQVGGNWLGQSFYTFSGGLTYTQASVGSTVTVSDIPVGTWAVLVTAGKLDGSGNYITTDYSGYPYTIVQVAPGVDNPVNVSLQASPVVPTSLFGTNVSGVANSGGVYAATPTQLYSISGSAASTIATFSGVTANSLSAGYYFDGTPVPFVNTTGGIYYYRSGVIDTTLAASNPVSVLDSGAFVGVSGVTPGVAIFYQNDKGLGGAWTTSASYAPSIWTTVDTSNAIVGKPFYDFSASPAPTNAHGYFASKLGAFQLSQSVVQNHTTNVLDPSVAKYFTVPDDSKILSVSFVNGSTNHLYIGSATGAWDAVITTENVPVTTPPTPLFTNPTKISATFGDSIIKIAALGSYVAFLSQYNLYVLNSTSSAVKVYPFYSGLPGQLTGMAWYNNGTTYTLYVSGTASTSIGASGGLISISGAGLP